MFRTASVLAALAAVLVATMPVGGLAQNAPPSRLDDLLDRYAAGREPDLIATTFPDHVTFLDWRVELFTRAREWRESWQPVGATLLLEISFWGARQGWPEAYLISRAAEDLVTGRQAVLGAAPAQDQFEITFHRAALAWLVGARSLGQAEEYLRRVGNRLVSASETDAGDNRLRDPRVALTHGILAEAWTAPGARAPMSGSTRLPALAADARDGETRAHLERALAALDSAAALPEVAEEATVRRAFVLHRLGRDEEALAALGLENAPADSTVRYWRHLFLGRVLEALARPAEAAAAYRAAADDWRGAQTPAVALAALFQRQGRAADARRWARVAGTAPLEVIDPWWHYWSGDLRFLPEWMADLRRSDP
jgi:hypothetical protein